MPTSVNCLEGNGPQRVLVLHGWALDSGVWLASRGLTDLERFTYAYVDFPGYGVDRPAQPSKSLYSMAKAALSAADELEWDRFIVMGHSMGGTAAIRVATLAPDRISAAIAITPASAGGTHLPGDVYQQYANAWTNPRAALHDLDFNLTNRELSNLVARCYATMDQNVWEAYLSNWTNADFLSDLRAIQAPTRIFYGSDDPLVNPDYLGSTMEGLQQGSLVRINGSGHYPMIVQPSETVQLWEKAMTELV